MSADATRLEALQAFLDGAFRQPIPIVDDPELANACALHVTGNARLSPAQQVDLYRRQYWLRHVDSLIEDFPGLAYVLGDEPFDALCRAYLEAHPPTSFTLRDLGLDLARFVEDWGGVAPERRALAIDMARYECAAIELFDGPDAAPLTAEALLSIPADAWETASFVLHPTLARLWLDHPVAAIRRAVVLGERPELPNAPEPTPLVAFRLEGRIHFEVLEPDALALLDAIAGGEPLGRACERVAAGKSAEAIAGLEGALGGWFRDWASWGLFVAIRC